MERQRSLRRRRKYDVPFSKKLKECVRSFVAFMFSNVGIIGLVVGYAIAGAFIFIEIEGRALKEIQEQYNATEKRMEIARKVLDYSIHINILDEKAWRGNVTLELIRYQNNTVQAIKDGFYNPDYSKQWSISGAFLFSLTVITTIGYGNIVPRTPNGKVATIIYAIIGMPLFLLYLSNIGDIMARSFKWIYATCCLCKGCPGVSKRRAERRRQKLEEMEANFEDGVGSDTSGSWQGTQESLNGYDPDVGEDLGGSEATTDALSDETFDSQAVTVPVTICLTIMVGYIFGGALLFASYEGWNYLDGSYFCFISLSTIGLGDIVPGERTYSSEDVGLSFIFCAMYLMLGMALIAMCFNLMQEEVIHKFRTTMATINDKEVSTNHTQSSPIKTEPNQGVAKLMGLSDVTPRRRRLVK